LQRAGLWDEVKDRLNRPGTGLSGGQAAASVYCARNCHSARSHPDGRAVLALDPIATARVEDLIEVLRESYAIVIVTHSMQQAARVSQRTAYFHMVS